jgi:hypothetical protein
MVVQGDAINNSSEKDTLFLVKDKDGKAVFAVFPYGVHVYIAEPGGAKTNETTQVSGFRVGKKTGTGTKGFGEEYFSISPSNTSDTIDTCSRMIWYPKKEAFASGRILVQSSDSVGTNSWASGYVSKSIGNYSQALGYQSKAIGIYSTAIGRFALAYGDNSFAFGDSVIAGGGSGLKAAANNYCYAFGKNTEATGNGSYAFGYKAKSTGQDAYAFGTGTEASGIGSFAIGFIGRDSANISTGNTKATADWAVAIGMGAQAKKQGAFSLGTGTNANSEYSFSFGYKCVTTGWYSISGGQECTSGGTASVSLGCKSNAGGNYSFAVGYKCSASSTCSFAAGEQSNATAWGVAIGKNANATQFYSIALGLNSLSSNYGSIAIGVSTNASGEASTCFGFHSTSSGFHSTAFGEYTIASGNYSLSSGFYTIAPSGYETVIGRWNSSYTPYSTTGWDGRDRLFVIGNGSAYNSLSNAMTVLKNGCVGINYDNPVEKLHVEGNSIVNGVIYGQNSSGSGDVLRIGNDSKLSDINIANTCGLYGIQNSAVGGIKLGSGGETVYGSNAGIGIGTTSPLAKLHVLQTTSGGTGIWGQTNGGNGVGIYGWSQGAGTTNYGVYGYATGATTNWAGYFTGGNVYIANNLAIGTTTPATKLHIRNGAIRIENTTDSKNWDINYDATGNYFYIDEYGTARHLIINNGGSVVMPQVYNTVIGATNRNLRIDNTGLIGWDGSSIRYKKDVRDMENIDWFYKLRPVNFVYKTDSLNTKKYGFIAEEVVHVNSSFVSFSNDGIPETVNYVDLISPMVKAIQELKATIDEQQNTINTLKAENSSLKKNSSDIEDLKKKYDELIKMLSISAEKK